MATTMGGVWVSELAPALGVCGTPKLGGKHENQLLQGYSSRAILPGHCSKRDAGLPIGITRVTKMQTLAFHPRSSPPETLSMNLHFKPHAYF